MKAEVVVVKVTPMAGVFVDKANANRLSEMGGKIDGIENHVFDFAASTGFVNDLAGYGIKYFYPGFGMRSCSDAVGRPGMSNLEG